MKIMLLYKFSNISTYLRVKEKNNEFMNNVCAWNAEFIKSPVQHPLYHQCKYKLREESISCARSRLSLYRNRNSGVSGVNSVGT